MRRLLNTLFITKAFSYVHKQNDTIVVECDGQPKVQLPAHAIANILCFGFINVSPPLMGYCGENGIGLAFFSEYGKFLARVQGRQTGNVLLRRTQYRKADTIALDIAKNIVTAKISNTRTVLQRYIRNHGDEPHIEKVISSLAYAIKKIRQAENLDVLRGIEGDSAANYFGVFTNLLTSKNRDDFAFTTRSRRPPLDPINAMLSFIYALVTQEVVSALYGVGLDPFVGFLHTDRPGRVSLALDMVEEFRAWWADRLVLSLINRQQVSPQGFEVEASGAVRMSDETRKVILQAYQTRKQEQILHPYIKENIEIGLLPHTQAMLMARYLRGDLEAYPPFLAR